ncbi:hypothetical protein AAGO69_27320, partial [Klebsiella pneumoniae]
MKYHRYLLCVIGVIVIGGCAPKQKLQQPALSLSSTLNSNVQSAADDVYQRENAPQAPCVRIVVASVFRTIGRGAEVRFEW